MSNWIYIDDIEVTDKIICPPAQHLGQGLCLSIHIHYLCSVVLLT